MPTPRQTNLLTALTSAVVALPMPAAERASETVLINKMIDQTNVADTDVDIRSRITAYVHTAIAVCQRSNEPINRFADPAAESVSRSVTAVAEFDALQAA